MTNTSRLESLLVVWAAVAMSGCGQPSWRQVRSTDGGFSVDMPGAPTYSARRVELAEGWAEGGSWCVNQQAGSRLTSALRQVQARRAGVPLISCAVFLKLPVGAQAHAVTARPSDADRLVAELKGNFLLGFESAHWQPENDKGQADQLRERREWFCRGRMLSADVVGRVKFEIGATHAYILYTIGPTEWTVTSPHSDRFFESLRTRESTGNRDR